MISESTFENETIIPEGAKTGYDLPPLLFSDFKKAVSQLPIQEEIIEGALPQGQLAIIAGDPWQGKSLEIQRLSCEFGRGGNYHGLNLKKCRALYLTWEGSTKGIEDRFEAMVNDVKPELEPVLKLMPEAIPLNRPAGRVAFQQIVAEVQELHHVEIILIDSFPYTFDGNARQDEHINAWYGSLMSICQELTLTPIVIWEFRKLIYDARASEDTFSLDRLKNARTTAYKANTVIAVGEEQRVVWNAEKKATERVNTGHQIRILKVKDAKGPFAPLHVKLNGNLLWTGERWQWNQETNQWEGIIET